MTDIERRAAIPARRSRVTNAAPSAAPDIEEEDDDRYYTQRPGTSARRYQQPRPTAQRNTDATQLVPQGSAISRIDAFGRPVIRQGNREYVMVPASQAKRRFHWSLFLGLTLLLMVVGWVTLSAMGTWWTDWRNYTDYGYPRMWQTDAIVGHNDSPQHPSHFIFMNLNGRAIVVEFPGGDPAKAIDYVGATLFGTNPSYTPVTGKFYDANGDGKVDMEIDYGGDSQVWLNNGSKFVPPGS
jgi:hypothetical protein